MQPTEARDVGDALDDRPVRAVGARPTHVGNEKYLGGFWIIEAFDLEVALKLDGFDESDRSQPAYQKVLKDIREAVSDRGREVRSRGERPPTRGGPEIQEMIRDAVPGFRDR